MPISVQEPWCGAHYQGAKVQEARVGALYVEPEEHTALSSTATSRQILPFTTEPNLR